MKKVVKFLLWLVLLAIVGAVAWIGYISTKIEIISGGVAETASADYIGIKKTDVLMKDYPIVMAEAFGKLNDFVKANPKIKVGKSFSMYEKNSEYGDSYDLVMAFMILEPITVVDEEVFEGHKASVKAAIYRMKGEYKYLVYGWMYAFFKTGSMDGYKIDENEVSFESYDVSYDSGVAPSDFVTTIYIPVVEK